MKIVYMLEDDDVIEKGDWCRPLDACGEVNTTSCYSGSPMNNTRWVKVQKIFGEWIIGMTVSEYMNRVSANTGNRIEPDRYEFVRGILPKKHIYKKS